MVEIEARPRRRKARGQGSERRDEILQAALHIFAERGFEAATMRNLADAVGLTTAGLYVYFPNKEAVFREIADRTFTDLLAELQTTLASTGDRVEAMRRGLRAYIQFGVSRPDEYRLAFMAKNIRRPAPGRPPRGKSDSAGRSFHLLQSIVAELVADGHFSPIDPLRASDVIWATLHGTVALLIDHPEYPHSGSVDFVNDVVEFIMRAFSAEAPSAGRQFRRAG